MSKNYDLVIIGGGPAGLAAAISAKDSGIDDVLVIERDNALGGILNQCIHNGFGLHQFKEELTGPEFANRFIKELVKKQVEYKLDTMVVDITADKKVTYINKEEGVVTLSPKAIILAMGCRERPRGAINIAGYRPAGVMTAGTAQYMVNLEGVNPGKEVVIIGSGDIGLIMARRMTLEGSNVKLVAEVMPYSGGLKRNIVQCLDDYNIPLKLSHTVVEIKGKDRVEGVVIAKVDENRKPIKGTEEFYSCDTLLLSVGLIPENELSEKAGVTINNVTSGPVVDERMSTEVEGIFACGNVLHVHDLADFVSEEGKLAGKNAAEYILGKENKIISTLEIKCEKGVRYTVPSKVNIYENESTDDEITISFRCDNIYRNVKIKAVSSTGNVILEKKKNIVAPGEMEKIVLNKKDIVKGKGVCMFLEEVI